MLVCISSTWNNITVSSKSWFGFLWVYLGLLKLGGCLLGTWDYLGLIAFHIINLISLTSVGRAFENLKKSFRRFQVFVLSYKSHCEKMGTTENLLIWLNCEPFYMSFSFQWRINAWGVFMGLNWSFTWKFSKKVHLDKEFFSTKQRTSLGAIVWEKWFCAVFCEIQILKVTYMSDLSKVFASLSNKFQSFQRFEIFWCFRIFVLSYTANSKRRKRRKIC